MIMRRAVRTALLMAALCLLFCVTASAADYTKQDRRTDPEQKGWKQLCRCERDTLPESVCEGRIL